MRARVSACGKKGGKRREKHTGAADDELEEVAEDEMTVVVDWIEVVETTAVEERVELTLVEEGAAEDEDGDAP